MTWVSVQDYLPEVGRRIEVSMAFTAGETGKIYSRFGLVEPPPPEVPRFDPAVKFKPDDYDRPHGGFWMSAKHSNAQCNRNAWRYIDATTGVPAPPTERENMNIYTHALRRMDGYQAVLMEGTKGTDDDTIIWEGETIHQDDEPGENFQSGYTKATKEAEAVKQAALKAYIAAGVKAVAKNG